MKTGTERRKNDRVPFHHTLQVRRLDSAEGTSADACDLSIAGMSFRTSLPLQVGDEVRIHITNVVERSAIAAHVRHVDATGSTYLVGVEHAPPA
jgi:hypothetical protein